MRIFLNNGGSNESKDLNSNNENKIKIYVLSASCDGN